MERWGLTGMRSFEQERLTKHATPELAAQATGTAATASP